MTEHQKPERKKQTKPQPMRPTIGLLTRKLFYPWILPQVHGVVDACRERDANLICFPGGIISHRLHLEGQDNVAYDLASIARLDGLIVLTSSVAGSVPDDEGLNDFYGRFHPLPIVGIERPLAGIPTILKSEYESMGQVLAHLIEVHGYRRIAYINRLGAGPQQERYRAYVDTLAKYGIPYDPDLVLSAHDDLPDFDEHNLRPGIDFEAVVTCDDVFALDALHALQSQGIRVPEQVAITGFDHVAESWTVTPPLTTVRPPFHEMGYRAVEMVLALLAGDKVPEQVTLPCGLVIRQSCGCMAAEVAQSTQPAGVAEAGRETLDAILATHRADIVADVAQAVSPERPNPDWAEPVLDGFVAEIKGQSPGLFLRELNDILRQVGTTGGEIRLWQQGLSALRRWLRPGLDTAALALADNLWHLARMMIGEVAERTRAHRALQAEQQAQVLREVNQELIVTFEVARLMGILAERLPRLGFPGGYLALYEMPQPYQYPQPDLGWSRLVLAYDERGRVELPPGGQRFPAGQLLPEEMWPDRQFSFVVEPLYFQNDQLGFALFEMGPREGSPYEALRGQISSALQGALLVEQVESHAMQLQTAAEVSRAAISTLELSALLQQVVSLVQQRFDLYYVGLFLVSSEPDSGSAWAVLRAASGEAGAQMLEQGHRLAVGGESMIGRCIADHQPRIASDVGEEAVRFYNPLLPETHSEIALPLITREGAIGALSVQSTERAAFGEAEVAVLETLAGQLANAIANARVYEQVAQAYEEIRVLNERLRDENLRMGAELAVTRRLQQMLLPTEEELRQIEDLDIVGFMQPADEVGGDYYDVLNQNGQIKIGIGDVTGHGLESGVVMLMLQTAVRTLMTSEEEDPVRFLNILNRLLQENTQRMQVSKSMTLALLDYHMGQMRVSGQHEQVIVVREGGQVELKDTLELGCPLGVVTGVAEFVHETSIDLQPGDGVVLYSDGITEAENEDGEFYGLERLCRVVKEHWGGTAEETKDAVIADVHAFIGEQTVYDDITLVVVKQK
jgi:serine phosphatase RsbU (regulator of sigma subunit)/DNA-binding LacI/PurR family transcriptional regulator/putative methionine-R-sulfoxide reductase with GAF domain